MTFIPDALTGSIFAVESIEDCCVVLNSPTGCKFYHAHISNQQYPRESSLDPLSFAEEFYFGQPRVPCTYLDEDDYVAGSSEKLLSILPNVAPRQKGPVVVINSPGATLIGDNLKYTFKETGLEQQCVAVESVDFSRPAPEGFEKTLLEILKKYVSNPGRSSSEKVNIIGLSVSHKHWEGTIKEIKRLLELMGIEVATVIPAGCTIDEIKASSGASFNIILCAEYGLQAAKWYEQEFGIPYVLCPHGAPVGFDATISFLNSIAEKMNVDASRALEDISQARKTAYRKIARYNSLTGLPKGATFSIQADSSLALPLTKWLYYYLGMAPMAVKILPGGNPEYEKALCDFMEDIGFTDEWDIFPGDQPVDIAIADGHTVESLRNQNMCRNGIEIALPAGEYLDMVQKTYMGTTGALMILEEVLNGIRMLS
ncbi:nitrogenase component 1 [Methanococcoides seepicolus]|jgi:nitrogenase molybdenum-iron protein alpha/beta subunit|uniref:Nitrogenase n=1 Tax=Methanococcoides seepicolus TaxID=2828780 RepID=A0A9E5DBF1_9EURY|nr:nitrogenase component 1 [Methanococcoides seepicolus]MCM1987041.1 nitrogenase [Methanococcoides seepicolus]